MPQRDLHLPVRRFRQVPPVNDRRLTLSPRIRPELVIDSTKDYSVSATDPFESMHQQQQATAQARLAAEGHPHQTDSMDPLVEGKGMLSWALAEKKEGTTLVCGRVIGSRDGTAEDARPSKRRRTGPAPGAPASDSEDDDSEAEEPEETLEVYLQLTEVRARRTINHAERT